MSPIDLTDPDRYKDFLDEFNEWNRNMIAKDTIASMLNEADELETRVLALREAATSLEKLYANKKPKPETNGVLLSAIAVPARLKTAVKAKKAKGKRKYIKRSTFWKKK